MVRAALAAEVVRTVIAAAAFLLLATQLPVTAMGEVATLAAVLSVLSPLTTMGLTVGITRRAARGDGRPDPALLLSVAVYGCAIVLPAGVAALLVLGVDEPLWALAAGAAAEAVTLAVAAATAAFHAGSGRGGRYLVCSLLSVAPRAGAAAVVLLAPTPSFRLWAASSLGCAVVALVVLLRFEGCGRRTRLLPLRALLDTGHQPLSVLLSTACSKLLDDLDKVVLHALVGATGVAQYALPYRWTGYALVPGRAVITSGLRGLHQHPSGGTGRAASATVLRATGATAAAAAAAAAAWPLAREVLPSTYAVSPLLVVFLAVAVVLKSAHYALGERLFATGSGRSRVVLQLAAAGLNAVALTLAIPRYGPVGAAAVTMASEAFLVLGMSVAVVGWSGGRRGLGDRRVVVYDIEAFNPYGRELAALLTAAGRDVELVCPRPVAWLPRGVRDVRSLVRLRSAHRPAVAALGHARTCGHLIARLMAGDVVVAVWTRDAVDELLLACAARLTDRVVVVAHNPRPRQRLGRVRATTYRAVLRWSTVVVHSPALLAGADWPRGCRPEVVPHLPFAAWVAEHVPAERREARGGRRLLFLGQLRPDKSPDDMAELLRLLPPDAGHQVVFAGKGELPDALRTAARGLDVVDLMRPDGLPDGELAKALTGADVLVAPYRGATQSGSVVLAVSAGLPVAAYRAGALPDLLPAAALVPSGDVAALALRALDPGLPAAAASGDRHTWRAETAARWLEVLNLAAQLPEKSSGRETASCTHP